MKTIYSLLFSFFIFTYLSYSQTVELTAFAGSFSSPIEMAHAGDSRLFVVEQGGVIKILNDDGTVNSTPFLDIDSIVTSGGERGLLGLAFAPDYSTTGRFYVNYINNSGNTVISRYTVSANPDVANPSGTILLTITQPYTNHNGGKMAFGTDGFLYISAGDGGAGGDPDNRSQNPNDLLGKLLRIDVSGSTYTIPATNPYATSGGAPEIYAIGLRNAWKFSFDRMNNDLWIADVGQNAFEEINRVDGSGTPGDNYGWRCFEGANDYNNEASCPTMSNTTLPVAEYVHQNTANGFRCSITGGYVYRGTMFPAFSGKYFFADYCTQEIGILTNTGSNWTTAWQLPNITSSWTSFGEDINGELYILGGSTVYKIADANLSVIEEQFTNFQMYPNPSNGEVTINFGSNFTGTKSITIINSLGQAVKNINNLESESINFSTNSLSNGLYFVEINNNEGSKTIKKLIVN
ncbi:PQQ-dependent sugar dehydrogenase [uncultured Lacinutrix sp.]|uniref:PQQ-dependent sugar dehydrogenase n=1 Tax=uncultured Lacinutrix sp. TaxID=574032 RepID=UPI00263188FA|nr:PQQ-dependent sugar dehydrogenase [uncultured Lacinutrix sp.]